MCTLPPLAPPPDKACLTRNPDKAFQEALVRRDVDSAYAWWAKEAERILVEVARRQGHEVKPGAVPRGRLPFLNKGDFRLVTPIATPRCRHGGYEKACVGAKR